MREDVEQPQRVIDRLGRTLQRAREGEVALRRRLARMRQRHDVRRRVVQAPGARRLLPVAPVR